MPTFFIIAAVSYLLGSIPFGYLLVKIFRGEDVRQSGSGNIGATNVSRKSPLLGSLTLILDALKGSAAVALAFHLSGGNVIAVKPYQAMAVAAFFAVLGHMFPLWLKFRGGKGVATGLGSFLIIAPKAVLVAAVIFIAVVLIFRYVSLASIIAVAAFPLIAFEMRAYGDRPIALVFMSGTSLLIVARHHENIRRLLAGTESRVGAKRA
ncbi:MAG: glycerol-3-phosphate 1-O-acyltransferase PlsY [Candidatus Sulfotelmatobacter sp.]